MASLNTAHDVTEDLESEVASAAAQKSYVLDTSVLLSDPKAVLRFAEHEVIIPIVVISNWRTSATTPSWATTPAQPCGCWTSSGSTTAR